MSTYADLTTVHDVRIEYLDPLGLSTNIDDTLILSIIRALSKDLGTMANRHFYPSVDLRYYDVPSASNLNPRSDVPRLLVDDDLLEVTTLTNGDGTVIPAVEFRNYPLNSSPKFEIALLPTFGNTWLSSAGNYEGAISVQGIWGYHADYDNAWLATGASLAITISTSSTTASVATGTLQPGHTVKMGAEFGYVSAVTTSTTTDTATIARGINGSTAAQHASGTTISRWYQPDLDMILRVAVAATIRLRDNPLGDTLRVGDATFSTPKDVHKWMDQQLRQLGISKVGIG